MRLIRRTMIACTAAVALSGLGMVPVLEAQTPGTAPAAKEKRKPVLLQPQPAPLSRAPRSRR